MAELACFLWPRRESSSQGVNGDHRGLPVADCQSQISIVNYGSYGRVPYISVPRETPPLSSLSPRGFRGGEGYRWTAKNEPHERSLAERLAAEKCSLETKALAHFSAIHLSALGKKTRISVRLRRVPHFGKSTVRVRGAES